MSTNANLPAGFSITTIDGQRCTAVPRSLTTLTGSLATAAAAQPPTTTSAVVVSTPTPEAVPLATTAIPVLQSSTPSPILTFSTSTTPALAASTSELLADAFTTSAELTTSAAATTSQLVTSALPASKGTTPTTSSSTPVAAFQSEDTPSPTPATGENAGNNFQAPSSTLSSPTLVATSSQSEESSTGGGISSTPKLTAAPIAGGVVGALSFIAIIALIIWLFRRRRKGRESLLTPLNTGRRTSFFRAERSSSIRSADQGSRWRSETEKAKDFGSAIKASISTFAASLKSKVSRERSATPNVNLNRGNSQFLDGPISQHSRNNSTLSATAHDSIKEKAADFWDRLKDRLMMRKNAEPADPFAAARGMSEKQAGKGNVPDFSQLLGMDDRDLQAQAERRRASLAGGQLGSLGLNFGGSEDPFADPKSTTGANPGWKPPTSTNPFSDPAPPKANPFIDPIALPAATTAKPPLTHQPSTYIDSTRLSRNPSRPPSSAIQSRYPSSIPSRDSYRDTYGSVSAFNATRKGKGRSDPFDLERPELWRTRGADEGMDYYPAALKGINGVGGKSKDVIPPKMDRVDSTATYGSKYSSGVGSLGGEWGDPGPDLGSSTSSLRGEMGSRISGEYEWKTEGGKKEEGGGGSEVSSMHSSPSVSSRGGVGKAR